MEVVYNKVLTGKIEVVGGSYVFKNEILEVKIGLIENYPYIEKIADMENNNHTVSIMLLSEHVCVLSKVPTVNLGDLMTLYYEYAVFNKEFSLEQDYLDNNIKIVGVRHAEKGNLFVTDNGVHMYQVQRLDNDRESLTYTKYVNMKLKDLDGINGTSLLFYLQNKHNRGFMYYLDNTSDRDRELSLLTEEQIEPESFTNEIKITFERNMLKDKDFNILEIRKVWVVYFNGELILQEGKTLNKAINWAKVNMFYRQYKTVEIKYKIN